VHDANAAVLHFDSVSMPGLLADPDSRCSTTPDEGNSLVRFEFSVVCVIFPLKAAFMASPATARSERRHPGPGVAIYVELIGPSFPEGRQHRVIKPDPGELAKASVSSSPKPSARRRRRQCGRGPADIGYKVELADMAKWDK